MRILVALNHPAHYFLFKFIINKLRHNGHEIRIVIKEKDILESLLNLENIAYQKLVTKGKRKKNALSVISKGFYELIMQDIAMMQSVNRFKPNLMVGTDIAITHIGRIKGIPSLVFNEDDYEINKLFCKTSYPFASAIVAPIYTSVGKYTKKQIVRKPYGS